MTEYDIRQYVRTLRIMRASLAIVILGICAFIGYVIFEVYFNGPQLDQLILQ